MLAMAKVPISCLLVFFIALLIAIRNNLFLKVLLIIEAPKNILIDITTWRVLMGYNDWIFFMWMEFRKEKDYNGPLGVKSVRLQNCYHAQTR